MPYEMSAAERERLRTHHGYQRGDHRDLEVVVHRAGAIGDMNVPTFAIYAHDPFPEAPDVTLDEACAKYADDARKIGDTLVGCLPDGTVHALVIYLLEHRLSLLRIPEPGTLLRQPHDLPKETP